MGAGDTAVKVLCDVEYKNRGKCLGSFIHGLIERSDNEELGWSERFC